MNASHQIAAQRRMHRPMPGDARLPVKSLRPDPHVEMAFAALAKPGMAAMAFAIVDNFQRGRVKSGHKP